MFFCAYKCIKLNANSISNFQLLFLPIIFNTNIRPYFMFALLFIFLFLTLLQVRAQ